MKLKKRIISRGERYMICDWKVECITNTEITDDEMQEIICSKIANVLINEENKIYTLENQ